MLAESVFSLLDRLASQVPLSRVLAKVLSDHARARFGEFRDAILGMISAHSFDARVLRTANQLLAADMFRQVRARSLRKRARARA